MTTSSILYKINTNEYPGGDQNNWHAKSRQIVADGAQRFRLARNSKENLIELFHNTLAFWAECRRDIAVQQKSEHAERFGERRDGPNFLTIHDSTGLWPDTQFYSYNFPLLAIIQEQLGKMPHTPSGFQTTKAMSEQKPCSGRRCRLDVSILNNDNIQDWRHLSAAVVSDWCTLAKLPIPAGIEQEPLRVAKHLNVRETARALREASITDYVKLKIHSKTTSLAGRLCEKNLVQRGWLTDWVHVTMRLEVNNKLLALSQYLTWMERDDLNDPVDKMTGRAVLIIYAQDPFLIATTLDEIAKIFKEALEWDGQNIQTLKDRASLIQYTLSHTMPFQRGSAAIAEWFEKAIYLCHGYVLTYLRSPNMIALTSPLDRFVEAYDSIVKLEKQT